ncbi:hypothetical protein [Saccharothrix sp. NRRL B-16348]|nr:hypothetical protein [Saccharothrix sp. NRRL B-16348]
MKLHYKFECSGAGVISRKQIRVGIIVLIMVLTWAVSGSHVLSVINGGF